MLPVQDTFAARMFYAASGLLLRNLIKAIPYYEYAVNITIARKPCNVLSVMWLSLVI